MKVCLQPYAHLLRIYPIKTKKNSYHISLFSYRKLYASFLLFSIIPCYTILFEIYMEMNYFKWVLVRIFQLSSYLLAKKNQEQETLVYFIVNLYTTTHKLRIYLHTISLRKHFADCVVVKKYRKLTWFFGFLGLCKEYTIHILHA